ncbi:hypothetical protein GQ600_4668 [Phytophthora cactorum]|nr:hypothetical protein GQ600_4668 [Phytophthora cactorum]
MTRQDNNRPHRKHRNDAMIRESSFDLALYTPEYKQPDSSAKNFRDGDAAWTRFLTARPLLYLPNRSSIKDEDPINRHRRLWTRQELQAFGDATEERTHAQLLLQERTLRRWHQSATDIQRCFRGMRGRFEKYLNTHSLGKSHGTCSRTTDQRKAVVAIQREYRCHRKLVIRRQRAAVILQSATKRFIHRRRRWQALLTMQRAARCFLWRLRWQRHRQQVRKMLIAAAREQQLVLPRKLFGEYARIFYSSARQIRGHRIQNECRRCCELAATSRSCKLPLFFHRFMGQQNVA